MSAGVQKNCASCGMDVSQQKRVKDQQGRYYCHPCWATHGPTSQKSVKVPVPSTAVFVSVDDLKASSASSKPSAGPRSAPGATAAASTLIEQSPSVTPATKKCPFCGETINAEAKKCRYCGEFLDRPTDPTMATEKHPQTAAAQTAIASKATVQSTATTTAQKSSPKADSGIGCFITFVGMIVGFFVVAGGVVAISISMEIHSDMVVYVAFGLGLGWIGLLAYLHDAKLRNVTGKGILLAVVSIPSLIILPLIFILGIQSAFGTIGISAFCVAVMLGRWYVASRTCPACGSWRRTATVGEEQLGTAAGYQTVYRTDYIKDIKSPVPIGTIHRQEQVAVPVRHVREYFRCGACAHTWTKDRQQ